MADLPNDVAAFLERADVRADHEGVFMGALNRDLFLGQADVRVVLHEQHQEKPAALPRYRWAVTLRLPERPAVAVVESTAGHPDGSLWFDVLHTAAEWDSLPQRLRALGTRAAAAVHRPGPGEDIETLDALAALGDLQRSLSPDAATPPAWTQCAHDFTRRLYQRVESLKSQGRTRLGDLLEVAAMQLGGATFAQDLDPERLLRESRRYLAIAARVGGLPPALLGPPGQLPRSA